MTSSQSVIDLNLSRTYSHSKSLNTSPNESVQTDTAGRHYIVDFWGAKYLDNADVIEDALSDAARRAGAVLLHIHIHHFGEESGVTGVALLAESHISVHTWPERGYAAFDVFMCGNAHPERAVECLKEVFKPERVELKEILRGNVSPT